MNGPENLQGALCICQRMSAASGQSFFVRPLFPLGISSGTVPGAGYDAFVATDLAVVNLHPVAQCAACGFGKADPLGTFRPTAWLPLFRIESFGIPLADCFP